MADTKAATLVFDEAIHLARRIYPDEQEVCHWIDVAAQRANVIYKRHNHHINVIATLLRKEKALSGETIRNILLTDNEALSAEALGVSMPESE